MAIMEECIPQSRLPKKRNLPWISKGVLTAMRRRNKCFKKAQRDGDHASKERYKDARNKALKMLRTVKKRYFANLKPNSKEFWKTVKLQSGSKATVPTLKHGQSEASSDIDKATALNNFFASCFNQSLPTLTRPLLVYRRGSLKSARYVGHFQGHGS